MAWKIEFPCRNGANDPDQMTLMVTSMEVQVSKMSPFQKLRANRFKVNVGKHDIFPLSRPMALVVFD